MKRLPAPAIRILTANMRRLVLALAIAITATMALSVTAVWTVPAHADALPAGTATAQDVYDAAGAAQWASTHANDDPSSNEYGDDDCTDFVSKAMHFGGGMQYRMVDGPGLYRSDYYWFPRGVTSPSDKASYSWASSSDLHDFLQVSGFATLVASGSNDLNGIDVHAVKPGDVIFANWKDSPLYPGTRGIGHAGMITGNPGQASGLQIAQHSPNHVTTLTGWADSDHDFDWWIYSIKLTTPPDHHPDVNLNGV
ncbi:amidase domain-containing protein [Actinoallomurus rhizosphaericola]|uniref:amidase domain-containing protein n=1 Tax=Actinoallomurus rhizosphaericola TaxID=2952536 RepID=UPI0020915F2E|nr:amidase domain-containing protein [Actinoallomurus rhizosphaericola]MCO5994490.1 amidase domain-containing protein [Actinoallomurus rhizosphaericola]